MKFYKLIIAFFIFQNQLLSQCLEPAMSIWENTWQSCETAQNPNLARGIGHWIEYDLGSIRKISKVRVWNTNEPNKLNNGFKDVVVDYSQDGNNWTELGTYEFPQGTGEAIYGGFEGFDFEGESARYVIVSVQTNYGGNCYGLAEVKFNLLFDIEGTTVPCPQEPCDEACEPPMEISWAEVETTEIFLEWPAAQGADSYLILFRPTGGDWIDIEAQENEEFLEELTPNTEYEIQLVSFCGQTFSEASPSFYYTTLGDPLNNDEVAWEEQQELSLYPNPANQFATAVLETPHSGEGLLQVTNLAGQMVFKRNIEVFSGKNEYLLPITDFKSGIYLVTFQIEGSLGRLTEKLVVVSN